MVYVWPVIAATECSAKQNTWVTLRRKADRRMTQLIQRRDSMSESDLTDIEGDLDKVRYHSWKYLLSYLDLD